MPRKKTNKKSKKENIKSAKRKVLEGIVVKSKMQKTVIVKVSSKKQHPLYKKIIKSSKGYKVHTEKDLEVGERVKIEQCRPISKDKKWKVIK